jgi:predicted nucleotidyltransferase
MTTRNELISYALDFTSYLLAQLNGINRVILFGSVARGDFGSKSDVDLFIDTKNAKLEKEVLNLAETFHRTQKSKSWKLKGVNNDLSCIVGDLDGEEWKDLKRGMVNNAIILYGKYKAAADKIRQYTLFSFGNIKPESKRVALHRQLFGFEQEKRKYQGLTTKFQLVRLGSGTILAPIEYALELKNVFKERKIPVKLYDVWSDYNLT